MNSQFVYMNSDEEEKTNKRMLEIISNIVSLVSSSQMFL